MAYGTVNADTLVTSTSGGILGAGNASIMKNRIINGAMVIDQRNAGASVTLDGSGIYAVDRFRGVNSTDGTITGQQSSTAPTGFVNSVKYTITATDTSLGATQFASIDQFIEGYNIADLGWGTANAKTVTLSFWVYSSLTGTFGGALLNNAGDRSYPFSYTISSANTWEQKSITIAGDTSGTWLTTNGRGIALRFSLGTGSTYSGTAGAWASALYLAPTGSTSVVGTSGATFYITGVQLEVGSSATGFEYVNYQTSLANCQRYYQALAYLDSSSIGFGLMYSSTSGQIILTFAQTMRATATVTLPAAGQTSGTISFITSAGNYPSSTGTNTVTYATKNMCSIQGSGYSASFTQGDASWLYPTGNVTVAVSAEL
jgi:hypothetical protein